MSKPGNRCKLPALLVLLTLTVTLFLTQDSAADRYKDFFRQEVATADQQLKAKYPWVTFEYQGEVHDWYKWLLLKSMSLYPEKHLKNLQGLTIKNMPQFPVRALIALRIAGGGSQIKLNMNPVEFPLETGFKCGTALECTQVTDGTVNRQVVAVLLHELGHVTDLGPSTAGKSKSINKAFSDGPYKIPEDDPSIGFYSICFASSRKLAPKKCTRNDFVSQYAKSEAFEDFAESMNVYITDNRNFYKKAKKYPKLMEKYEFIKNNIFDGKEFALPAGEMGNLLTTYDSTLRRFDIGLLMMKYAG